MDTINSYEKLLQANKEWATEQLKKDPDFFLRLSHIQTPEFLWIGCSDSRVPADKITGTQPGEIFVHRNIANIVANTDVNIHSVLEYAVDFLKVKHIIVCGHYGCGGIRAAIEKNSLGIINNWLRGVKDIYQIHKKDIDKETSIENKTNKLVELNVQEQVFNLAKTSVIQKAWKHDQRPHLHGWVFDIHHGNIKEIININAGEWTSPVFHYDF